MVRRFSRHFVARWAERMGTLPFLDDVNTLILEGQQIHRQRILYGLRDGTLVRHTILAEYWNARVGVIIRVDDHTGTAVTVITPRETDNGNTDDRPSGNSARARRSSSARTG